MCIFGAVSTSFTASEVAFHRDAAQFVFWLLMHSAVQKKTKKNNPSCGGEAVEEPSRQLHRGGETLREIKKEEARRTRI